MAKKIFHIVPQDNGWAVKNEGSSSSVSTHSTQREAIDEGRKLATDDPDEVDLIIHRTNGTIRERLSFGETTNDGSNANGNKKSDSETRKVGVEDLVSVGTRVSWGAVLAGVVVALTTLSTLGLLGFGIGVSAVEDTSPKALAAGVLIWGAASLFIALAVGGWTASRMTAGETMLEGIISGILVWGGVFAVASLIPGAVGRQGFGEVYNRASGAEFRAGQGPGQLSPEAMQKAGFSSEEQRKLQEGYSKAQDAEVNVKKAAWWSFILIVLSLLTAVGGAMLGTGPEIVFARMRERDGKVVVPTQTATGNLQRV